MKRRKCQILTFFFTCLLFLSACGDRKTENQQQTTPTAAEQSSVPCDAISAVNAQGNSVQAFLREADGIWYLAVPSSWDLEELEIRYTGDVIESQKGRLNQANASISGAFSQSGDSTVLKMGDGTSATVMVLQSDLPSVQITLNGVTLDDVHANKDTKHKGTTVLITDAAGNAEALDDAELKGRGNSTWQLYEKKGYQIKLSQETSVLGMEQAAKWVLLSNASDDSMLRTRVVYDAAKQMDMSFVPEFQHVDMWINGEYRGTYMIGEKVELGSSRLDLKDPLGTLFERDDAFYESEDYWIYNNYLNAYFTMKDSMADRDQLYRMMLKVFSGKVDQLMSYLYSTPSGDVTLEALSTMIDVDSFALYYLVNEYAQNRESLSTSFYWYTDGHNDPLHLGPIWDFDTCMGNDGTANTENYSHNSLLFRYLLAVPEFYQRTQELYRQYQSVFDSMADNAEALGAQIEKSAEMNYLRWDVLGTESAKVNGIVFSDSFSGAVTNLKTWLSGRAKSFMIPQTKVAVSTVSSDFGTLTIRYADDMDYDALHFAVWNRDSEDGDVMWYEGIKKGDLWTADADLSFFQSKGLYQINVHTPDSQEPIATGTNYVAGVKENHHTMGLTLSEDMNEVTVTVEDPLRQCLRVYFVVWSTASNQEDLRLFTAEKPLLSTQWRCTIDLSDYEADGEYSVHVLATTWTGEKRLNATTFMRYRTTWEEGENPYLVDVKVNEDASQAEITLTGPVDDCKLVNFLVWSSANQQADLQVFAAEKTGEGQWSYTVDLTLFDAEGEYNVHVFGEKPYAYIKLNTTVFYVDPPR